MATARLSTFPEYPLEGSAITLQKRTAAIQIVSEENGRPRLGMFMDLMPGSRVEISGEGFTEKTVQVRVNGMLFYVLRTNLQKETYGRFRVV